MKVQLELSEEYTEPQIIIRAASVTNEVQSILSVCEQENSPIIGKCDEKTIILQPKEIYMARVENKEVILYLEKKRFISCRKLYELENLLGNDFMRISKTTIVNLRKIESVEPAFNAMMYLVMKNGNKDYITRRYLPNFKKYLGL